MNLVDRLVSPEEQRRVYAAIQPRPKGEKTREEFIAYLARIIEEARRSVREAPP